MAGRACRGLIRSIAFCAAALLVCAAAPLTLRAAQPPAPAQASTASEQTPQQVRELLQLLADPEVRAWLDRQRGYEPAAAPPFGAESHSIPQYLASRVEAAHAHITALAGAFPDLPAEFARAWHLFRADLAGTGMPRILLLLLVFAGLGFGTEWLFQRATRKLRRYVDERPIETARDRVPLVVGRLTLAAGLVAAFAIGSVGAFLAFAWPPLLREIVLGYLVAVLTVRVAIVIGHFLLAPSDERFRIVPVDVLAVRFWHRRIYLFVGWFAFGFVTIGILRTLGLSLPGRQLVAYALGLGLLAIALEAVWRHPLPREEAPGSDPSARRLGEAGRNALMSTAVILLWVLWVVQAMPSFWLVLVITVVPVACRVADRAVKHLLRPPASASQDASVPSVGAVLLERGIRAVLIISAIALLAWGWGIHLQLLAEQDSLITRVLRGALSAVAIALIADVIWQAAKARIDRTLAQAADLGQPNTPQARRRARIRTLLPIARNLLFVVVASVAAMMALATLGVEIGPLIAGAGVVGVAIGFGAQAFVRDVIAGVFYLIDDAFRVGEYIQSGNYKGTVESFSIRSVRLRHHRGPVYTVPFSLLGAVQNMSRDWVIDKLLIGITYDSDLDLARKLIKQIGQELAKTPEFAPLIIEPLKMQGVEQFGDFAVQIRLKMMTVPGEQFVIRRKAYAMIKKAFDANGIKFAFPTVQVAGDGEPASAATAAVAGQALELVETPKVA